MDNTAGSRGRLYWSKLGSEIYSLLAQQGFVESGSINADGSSSLPDIINMINQFIIVDPSTSLYDLYNEFFTNGLIITCQPCPGYQSSGSELWISGLPRPFQSRQNACVIPRCMSYVVDIDAGGATTMSVRYKNCDGALTKYEEFVGEDGVCYQFCALEDLAHVVTLTGAQMSLIHLTQYENVQIMILQIV